MEADFDTVKALSSRTRIHILNETLGNESTPTDISNAVGRSKSKVSSHLKKLEEAGLLKRDGVKGRIRVVYRPTDKTKAIINSRNRKVKFSILSSISTVWIGLGLSLKSFKQILAASSIQNQVGLQALDQGAGAAGSTSQTSLTNLGAETLLFAGLGLLSISLAGLVYGFVITRLGK